MAWSIVSLSEDSGPHGGPSSNLGTPHSNLGT